MASVSGIEIPEFPANALGLVRGSILVSTNPRTRMIGVSVGEEIPIGFDGRSVRCGPCTWSIEQICNEILYGTWTITRKVVDFSDEGRNLRFAQEVEHLG